MQLEQTQSEDFAALNAENSLLKEGVKALQDSYFLKDNQLILAL